MAEKTAPGAPPPSSREAAAKRFSLPRIGTLPALSMLIASLSLASSISQSFNYRKNIESVQQNLVRAENLKTCRELIEVYFAFRLKAEDANAQGLAGGSAPPAAIRDIKSSVYRFGALGTYLANFAPEKSRARYTALTWKLNEIAEKARSWTAAEFEAKFAEADKAFDTLNEDCANSAQFIKL